MKTKLSRIMGVGLALILVLTLAFALAPAKETEAIEGEQLWLAQPMPTNVYFKLLAGSEVTEFAIASDGLTIYLIDGRVNLNAAGAVYKSLDGGVTWSQLPAIAANAVPVTNVAVAPDNPDAVAVSGGSDALPLGLVDEVWVSTNGGTTWSQLPAPNLSAANMRIMDVKVAPARVGTLLPHEFIIATSDNAVNTIALGTLQMIGQTAAWTNIQAGGTYDFTSCELSPGYAGDRIATAVGSENATPATDFCTYNTQTPALAHAVVNLSATSDYDGAAAAGQILNSDIALPIDYDVTVPGFERAFAGTASTTVAADNVWRCDATLPAQGLGLGGTPVRSLAYSGTTTAGTLFEGNWADAGAATVITQVNWTTQMTTNLPVWYPSRKPPTGCDGGAALGGGRAYVRTSPTFDADSKVYVGTSDGQAGPFESALSLSTDAGDTYNQIAFIDNGVGNTVVAEHALALTPDSDTLFMVTDDGTEISLWQTPSGPAPFTWDRIYCVTAAGPMLLALNMGGWADAPEIYMANTAVAANGLYASYDGGKIFTNKHLPLAASAFISVAGSKTVYLAIGTNVYKSINGGQQWGPPINANVGAVATVLPAPNGDILAGGLGLASISTDGGASFAQLQPGLPAQTIMVMPDEGYTDNNTVYGFDNTGATGVYRLNIATGAIWENLAAPTAANILGFGQSNSVLYAMSAAACDRTLDELSTVGTINWGTMNVGAPAAAAGCFTVADNSLYVGNGAILLWAYNDQMATATTTITSPANGDMVPVDPVNGRGVNTVITWTPLGTGQGLATGYDIMIYDTAAGPPGGIVYTVVNIAAPNRTAPATDTATIAGTIAPAVAGFTLLGGHEYGIMIRASTELGGDNVVSPMCDPVIFSVEASGGVVQPPHAGPLLTSPNPGDQDVDPGCAFSWAPMSGVTEYELIIALDAALTQPVAGTPVTLSTTAYGPVELEYDTDYYYAVRATAPTSSVQSIGAFHTKVSPEAEAPPVVVEQPTVSPAWIWAVVIIGALLVIAVLVLIVRTRRA